MSDRWAITLDPKTFRFKLQSNVKEKDLCIKHLSRKLCQNELT